MKALSMTQPWATLVAIGAKKIETRSWYTIYRGPLAIHAAKGFPRSAREFTTSPACYMAVLAAYVPLTGRVELIESQLEIPMTSPAYPLGAVIAVCGLAGCFRIDKDPGRFPNPKAVMAPPPEPELSFGDYTDGRWAWMLENVVALPEPIPAKGALGLWEWQFPEGRRR